jgi:hypothetical protein
MLAGRVQRLKAGRPRGGSRLSAAATSGEATKTTCPLSEAGATPVTRLTKSSIKLPVRRKSEPNIFRLATSGAPLLSAQRAARCEKSYCVATPSTMKNSAGRRLVSDRLDRLIGPWNFPKPRPVRCYQMRSLHCFPSAGHLRRVLSSLRSATTDAGWRGRLLRD